LPDQVAAGMDEDDEFEEHSVTTERPGHTIGQPAMMSGMSRNLLHSNSISNAPNLASRGRAPSVRFPVYHAVFCAHEGA
jgi:hypothetical protein